MTRRLAILMIGLVLALTAAAILGAVSAPGDVPDALVVFTQLPARQAPGPDARFPEGSRLAAIDPAAGVEPVVLTPDFAAARAADVHFDGRRIVFAGQKQAGGPWQIWEMDLARGKARLVVASCERCTDPVYRADDGIAFVAPADGSGAGAAMAVYTIAPGALVPERITFHRTSVGALGLASDGRVIMATGEGSPADGPTEYWALRHDGTGAELLYRHPAGSTLLGRARETVDRDLVFVERTGDAGPRLVSVSTAYPETSRREIPLPPGARVHSVAPLTDGSRIVSMRGAGHGDAVYGLSRVVDGGDHPLVMDPAFHAVEPVAVEPRPRPLGFVTATDPAAGIGTFFGLDARLTGLGRIDSAATVLRVRTPAGELGEVPLAGDGSFLLELPPDTPLQFETADARGRRVRGPSAWIWVRPGEVRGCVGCHESRSLVPENRVPVAVTGEPVSLVPGEPSLGERPPHDEGGM